MSKIDSIDLDDEEENPRIDAIGNKIKLENLFEESDYYEDYTPKLASEELDIWPKTAKRHMESLVGHSTNGGRIEKTYIGGIESYRKNACPVICDEKKKAKKRCDEENKENCPEEESWDGLAKDFNCVCREENITEYSALERLEYSA